jgi:hypothetical protein
MNSILKLMARLTGEALSEKVDKVGHFVAKAGKNVVKGLGVAVVAAGLAGCPQPTGPSTNGKGKEEPTLDPNTVKVINGDIFMPKPEIGWSNERSQTEVNTAMTLLRNQCNNLYEYAKNYQNDDDMGIGLVINAAGPLNTILTDIYNHQPELLVAPSGSALQAQFDIILAHCVSNIIGNSNMPSFKDQFNAFRMGTRAEQRVYLKPSGGISIQKETDQNNFTNLITNITQNHGVSNLPQSGDYKTTLAQLRANLNGFIPATANKAFFNNLLQMIEDVEQFIGFVTDLGGMLKDVELQAQAANKSNVKIAFPEPQAQPKLTRAEIQAQHGIVNSEELLHG